MATPLSKEKYDQIIDLRSRGTKINDIISITGISRSSVFKTLAKKFGSKKLRTPKEIEDLKELMTSDRPNMLISDIAEKYGVSISTVSKYTRGYAQGNKTDLELLKRKMRKDRETMTIREVAIKHGKSERYVTLLTKGFKPKKAQKAPKERLELNETAPTNKGFAKVRKEETVFQTRNQGEYRKVKIGDSKNTELLVPINDPRPDDIIRQKFIQKTGLTI